MNDNAHGSQDVSTYEFGTDYEEGYDDSLAACGRNHVCSIEQLHRVVQGKAVSEREPVVVEVLRVLNDVNERVPGSILLCVEEPSTSLNVQVHYEIEDKLEELERQLNALNSAHE